VRGDDAPSRAAPAAAGHGPAELPPDRALLALGASEADLEALRGAAELVRITTFGVPSPPFYEWAARSAAVALAEHLGVPVLDGLLLRQPAELRPSIADTDGGLWSLRGWLRAPMSFGDDGGRVTSLGLDRYGLPELETTGVPRNLLTAWGEVTAAAAQAVFTTWMTGLNGTTPLPATIDLPDEIPLSLRLLGSHRQPDARDNGGRGGALGVAAGQGRRDVAVAAAARDLERLGRRVDGADGGCALRWPRRPRRGRERRRRDGQGRRSGPRRPHGPAPANPGLSPSAVRKLNGASLQ